jgi:hypothetical protein
MRFMVTVEADRTSEPEAIEGKEQQLRGASEAGRR